MRETARSVNVCVAVLISLAQNRLLAWTAESPIVSKTVSATGSTDITIRRQMLHLRSKSQGIRLGQPELVPNIANNPWQ